MVGAKAQMASAVELKAQEILEKEERSFGYTAIPSHRLIKKLLSSSGIPEVELLAELNSSGIIEKRENEHSEIFYSTLKASTLEKQIAEQFCRLIKTFNSVKKNKRLTKADMRLGKKVNPSDEQLAAVNTVVENGVTIITGGPGTGKTTMILGLVRALKGLDLSITLCAPTGKAAKRMGEATGLQKFNPSTVHRYLQNVGSGASKKLDVMIVDEASMLDNTLLHNLLSTIPDGARLVLIGDKDQLPPVAAGQPFKDIIETTGLNRKYASNEKRLKPEDGVSGIVTAAYDVINGYEPDYNLNLDEHHFEFIECPKEDIATEVLDFYFDKIPAFLKKPFQEVQHEIQILSPQKKGNAGITQINTEVQNRLTAKGDPISQGKGSTALYSNDRVMQTANDYNLEVMNGEIGTIEYKNENGLSVLMEGKAKIYDSDQAENLELAYAISIHKSQGSEYSAVIIPITSEHSFMLTRSLIYTAITRGKSKVCLIGEREVFNKTIENSFKGSRYTGLSIELNQMNISKLIKVSRLTEVYRQKKK